MKIPKYIDSSLKRRTKLAEQLNEVSLKLDDWLENNEIPTCNDYTRTGCMIYCEPYTAEWHVRDDILSKE